MKLERHPATWQHAWWAFQSHAGRAAARCDLQKWQSLHSAAAAPSCWNWRRRRERRSFPSKTWCFGRFCKWQGSSIDVRYGEKYYYHVQGRAKKIMLSSVAHVPSGLMGCASAAPG